MRADVAALSAGSGLDWDRASQLQRALRDFDAKREAERASDMGIKIIRWDDPAYPDCLKSAPDAPLLLYAMGSPVFDLHGLAVVGSRFPTPYGRRMARTLVREACPGLAIVSGMARGIDTEAHRAALECGGRTWAVLGSGFKRMYPAENAGLAQEIARSGGCVLSEFPLDAPPIKEHFPRRNRIVAALSWGTIVVEGREQSGALITARLAGELGREVFAVPGPVDSPLSAAPLRLLSQGAKLVRSMADVWPELPPGCRPPKTDRRCPRRTPLEALARPHRKILELLGSDTRSLEELSRESGLDLGSLSETLLTLELQDLVEAVPGQRYAKKEV
jgi:DNA processing protein